MSASKNSRRKVGFVGWPDEKVMTEYKDAELIDLDNAYPGVKPVEWDDLPNNVCHIVKRIVANAMHFDLEAVVVDDGPGKCDMARMATRMLAERIKAPVIFAPNSNNEGGGTPICDSTLPVFEKAVRILDGLTEEVSMEDMEDVEYEANPPAALWGVPAADMSLYKLFPDGTRLTGWFRCLENRTPADEKLEMEVTPGVPTVFFAQTFCHKNIIAKHLAKTHGGLYVDADGSVTGSVKAKIEAFLKFNPPAGSK